MSELLLPEEKETVEAFTKSIDVTNTNSLLQFGAQVQNQVAELSDSTLQAVKSIDAGEVAQLLSAIVSQIKEFDTMRKRTGIFKRLWKRKVIQQYECMEQNVDKIVLQLELRKIQLMKDIALYDHLYQKNQDFFKSISLHILASEQKLEDLRARELPQFEKKAAESKDTDDIQAQNDFVSACNRLEKKIADLKLTKTVCLQMAAQIRALQANESQLAEKIKSTIANTIPLWKSQMALALGIASVETSPAINDTETLNTLNTNLIQLINKVLEISEEGRELKRGAVQELSKRNK